LSKDVSEKTDLASQMPEKVAELTQLHDAWLAGMADPVGGEGKRFGMASQPGSKPKKPKSERKKNKPAPSATSTASTPAAPSSSPTAPTAGRGVVRQSFASLPGKPWKTARGDWEARDGAVWAAQKPGDTLPALLRGPAEFRGGVLQYELNLAAGSSVTLRFKEPSGDMLTRTEVTPKGITLAKINGRRNEILKNVSVPVAPGAWHKLTLKFDGPELYGTLDETVFIVADSVFERDKSEIDFLVSGGPVGFRSFQITPAANEPASNGPASQKAD
jgi:hypothetical protein